MRSESQASLATVLLLISRETFRNLSRRIYLLVKLILENLGCGESSLLRCGNLDGLAGLGVTSLSLGNYFNLKGTESDKLNLVTLLESVSNSSKS